MDRMANAIEETMASQAMMFAPGAPADLASYVQEALQSAKKD